MQKSEQQTKESNEWQTAGNNKRKNRNNRTRNTNNTPTKKEEPNRTEYGNRKHWYTNSNRFDSKRNNQWRNDQQKNNGVSKPRRKYHGKEPIRKEPIRKEPIRKEPIRKEPIRKEPIRKEPEHGPKPVTPTPIPTGPNYASIITKDTDKSLITENESSDILSFNSEYTTDTRGYKKTPVRNKILRKNNNGSYDVWEYTYYKHILDLSNIFALGTKKLGIETESYDFLEIFAHFIRDCSSGEISPYIENLSERDNESYIHFAILRNNH